MNILIPGGGPYELAIEGDVAARDCLLRFKRDVRVLAVASISRDIESLKAEVTMEQATDH